LLENRIDLYREWLRSDKDSSSVLFPPDLSGSKKSKGKAYRQLWFTFEGGARYFDQSLKKGWLKTPRRWRMILSLAFAEIIWCDLNKAYAPINEWVGIAKSETGEISSKVINGTLRSLLRSIEVKKWDLEMSLPVSLIKLWCEQKFKPLDLVDILRDGNHLFWHPLGKRHQLLSELGTEINFDKNTCWRLSHGNSPELLLESEGLGFFQNITAARLANEVSKTISDTGVFLDYCAAPGGKTWQIAKLLPNKQIRMYEFNQKRSEMIRSNKILSNLPKVKLLEEKELAQENYSEILIDVPCSNSGVLVKSPEAIRHFWIPEDVFEKVQKKMLEEAYDRLGGVGILFYSTCSMNIRENSARVNNFILEYDCELLAENSWYPDDSGAHGGYLAQIKL